MFNTTQLSTTVAHRVNHQLTGTTTATVVIQTINSKCNIYKDLVYTLSFLLFSLSILFIKQQTVNFILNRLPTSRHGWTLEKHLQHKKCSFSLTNSTEHVTKTNKTPKTDIVQPTWQCSRLIGCLLLKLHGVGQTNIKKSTGSIHIPFGHVTTVTWPSTSLQAKH